MRGTRTAVAVVAGLALLAGCGAATTGTAAPAPSAIQPMTTVTGHPPTGYFSDPYPVRTTGTAPQTFTGTTPDVLSCAGVPAAGCFHGPALTVRIGDRLAATVSAAGARLRNEINNNAFQDDSGAWQLAVTYYVSSRAHPDATAWTVVLHAHPAPGAGPGVPDHWIADTLLVGSLTDPTKANYDGKYVEDGGALYLVYSARLPGSTARDGIVAQPMVTAAQPEPGPPTVLLAPDGYASELFDGLHSASRFQLIETGNITKVDGKYVLAYSTGAFDEPDYKIGLAWSDTLLPAPGGSYRKLTTTDTAGVWGKPGATEVRYLLQSQEPRWPGYVAATVLAPGVPAVIEDHGAWYLTFAGYAPSDAPTDPKTGHYVPSHRRPYFAPLAVHVPAGARVSGTTAAALAGWITLGTNR